MKKINLLRKLINAVGTSFELDSVLNIICIELQQVFQVDRVGIARYWPEQDEWEFLAAHVALPNIPGIKDTHFSRNFKIYIKNTLIERGEDMVIDNLQKSDQPDYIIDEYGQLGIKSILNISIKKGNSRWGILGLFQDSYYRHWTQDEIELLHIINDYIYVAINQAELFSTTKHLVDREALLRKITETIRSSLDINETLTVICDKVAKLFKVQRATIIEFPDPNNYDIFKVRREYTISPEIKRLGDIDIGFNKKSGKYWSDILLKKDKYLAIDNISEANIPDYFKDSYIVLGVKSLIGVPIRSGQDKWGTLSLSEYNYYRHWTKEDLDLLESIASQIYIAIKQAELYNSVKQTAERAALLRKIVDTIRSSLDINEIKTLFVNNIGNFFKADRVFFAEFNPQQNMYLPVDKYSEYLSSSKETSFIDYDWSIPEAEEYIQPLVEKQELIIYNVDEYIKENPKGPGFISLFKDVNVKSSYNIPVLYSNELIGYFCIEFTQREYRLTKEELEFIRAIVNQSAIALYQAKLFITIKQTAERETLLRKVVETIRSTLDIDETLTIICDEVAKLFNVQRAIIVEFPKPHNYEDYVIRREYRLTPEIKGLDSIEYDKKVVTYWAYKALDEGINLIIDNIPESDTPDYFKNTYKALGVKSVLGFPIKKGENNRGIFVLSEYNYYRHWTEEEINLLETIASQVYMAINQAELYNTVKQTAEREALLRRITETIRSSIDINEIKKTIVYEIGKTFNADRCYFRVYDKKRNLFLPPDIEYLSSPDVESMVNIKPDQEALRFFSDEIMKRKKNSYPIVIEESFAKNYDYIDRYFTSTHIKAVYAVPVCDNEDKLIYLALHYVKKDPHLNEDDKRLLETLANQTEIAIEHARLFNTTKRTAEREKLLRNIVTEVRKLENHNQIFDYLLENLINLFNIDRAIHLHYDIYSNLIIKNEKVKDDLKLITGQNLPDGEISEELISNMHNRIIVVDDVDTGIKNPNLRNFLINNNIKSFLLYSIENIKPDKVEKPFGLNIICCSVPRVWPSEDIDSFKLIIETTCLVYNEIKQRKESEDVKQTFLATLTHDLRSPINAEQKALEAILAKKLGTSLDNFSEFLQDIYKTNEELLRIVNNILSVYHYESGKFELIIESCNINDLINDSISSMKSLAKDHESEIVENIQKDLPAITIDKSEIIRVINNLISNAIKHNKKGTSIRVQSKKINNSIQVSISDNGKGIPEKDRPKIFYRYPTEKRKIGTGLGLYLSKQIIDAHNGKIWFETEEGKGTAFCFTLPIT